MKAISLWQPWASLCVIPRPCDCHPERSATGLHTYGCSSRHPFKTIETRSWKAPDSQIGQRIAIHAAKKMPPSYLRLGESGIRVQGFGRNGMALVGPGLPEFRSTPRLEGYLLPFGKVVGTAVLADCVPMVGPEHRMPTDRHLALMVSDEALSMYAWNSTTYEWDWTLSYEDQRPFGWFEPGRWAWIFDRVEPIEPVPATGRQGIWNWGEG